MTLTTIYSGTLAKTGSNWSAYTNCAYSSLGDEIVYSFTPASSGNYTFTGTATSGEPDFYLMSSCDNTSTNLTGACWDSGDRTVALTLGVTYYVVIDNYYTSSTAGYTIVVNTAAASPGNDECANATPLTVGASCSFGSYTNANATASAGAPAPGCANYLGGDVWFKATVPASGHLIIDMQEGVMTDAGLAIYSGSCGSLTLVACDDDNSNNGLMSMIDKSGLAVGSTIYIRVWEYGNNNNGTFSICVYDPGLGACGSISTITACGNSTTVTSGGGSGNWNNSICGTGTPGVEKIYAFTATITAAYYLTVTSASSYMTYGYQASTCQSGGWTCIGRINAAGSYGPMNMIAGTTYYLIIDDEDASSSSQTFYIKCPETPGTYYHPTQGLQGTYLGACMVSTSGGVYTDDGGAANYSDNINQIYRTFCPNEAGKCMRATVNNLNIESSTGCANDYLMILNGPTQGSSMLWGGCGNYGATVPVQISTDPSGCLTFLVKSNATTNASGWNITLDLVNCGTSPTNNDCNTATAICGATNVNAASPGPGITSICGGCNLSEDYSSWYHFEVTNSGRLYLDIKPEEFFEDYDMALFKANNCAGLGDPVRCTYAQAPSYCRPNSSGTAYYISNALFNTINNTSTYNSSKYSNYTSSLSTTVTAGSCYDFKVKCVAPTTGSAANKTIYIVAWFDWNKNLIFDAGEFVQIGFTTNGVQITKSILIPLTARLGKTGCRLYAINSGYAPAANACTSYADGEIEDYAIFITNGTHCSDGVKDADEVGVDCGGADCVSCSTSNWATNTGMKSSETDASEDVTGNSWVSGIPVNAGESYYLLVNNWSPGANGFDLLWDFAEGGAMNCAIVLPIELLDFTATRNEIGVQLDWATLSETNNDRFEVLKSFDANIWKNIGTVKGAGNSSSPLYYTLADPEWLTKTTYYRLKQVDADGKIAYSDIVAVNPDEMVRGQELRSNYNSNSDRIFIRFTAEANTKYTLKINSLSGAILYTNSGVTNNIQTEISIPASDFGKGMYIVSVLLDQSMLTNKLMIIR
jgi:hypothetical protein